MRVAEAAREGIVPARPRRRSLDRARHARRHGVRPRAGRRHLARRPRRPEHAGDDAERQRARHAAGRCARAGADDGFASDRLAAPLRRARAASRCSAAGASTTASDELIRELGLAVFTMSEIDRRGLEAVVRDALDVVAGALVRPPVARPRRRRSRGRAGRRHAGARRAVLPRGAPRDGARRRGRDRSTRSRSSR